MLKPELLSPAGSLDKLKVAVSCGADAVYLAGQNFGLRTAAENFTIDELDEGIAFAHANRVKVFVVLNGFLHDSDLELLKPFIHQLTELKADAVIASDLGVIRTVAKESPIPIHLSTQASCLNRFSAKAWKKSGVHRLILGREVSIKDAGRIKRETGLEVELFIHGSMCMAYSGNCTISNYTKGRDSNRGGCAQSCRFKYSLDFKESSEHVLDTAFMSSKDLNGLELLPEFFEQKIDSLKIEGRMKSPMYTGMVSRVYRDAIDTYTQTGTLPLNKLQQWQKDLDSLPNRSYTQASLIKPADSSSINHDPEELGKTEPNYLGLVRKVIQDQYTLVEVRQGFSDVDPLEIIAMKQNHLLTGYQLKDALGSPIRKAPQSSLIRLPFINGVTPGQVLRKARNP